MKDGLHIASNGTQKWYQNGKLHREDGPAIVWADGSKFWYQNNQRHRLDGPAIECCDGENEWYIDNVLLTEEAWKIQSESYHIQQNLKAVL